MRLSSISLRSRYPLLSMPLPCRALLMGKQIHSWRWGLICLIKVCFSSHALLPPLPASPNSVFKNNPELLEQQSPADPQRGWALLVHVC